MAVKIHAHLKEIEAWLKSNSIKYDRIGTDLCFWVEPGHRVIVRHNHKDDEINILLPNTPGFLYTLSCKEFSDERVLHFQKACARLRLWLSAQKNR